MNNLTYYIETYGCQMNEHDSEKIAGLLKMTGYTETTNKANADLIIFNTCLIRENAELKVYGKLGEIKKLKKNNPDLHVAVCGCMVQNDKIRNTIMSKFPFVDIIFGTNNIHELPDLIDNANINKNRAVKIIDETDNIREDMPKIRKFDHKALINITYGCNNFCSYCVVPYTRGREKSRSHLDIIKEVKELADNNCKEITLLGQNVNSYGHTLDQEYDFSDLLYDLNKIEGIDRIRFMTSHPKDFNKKLINSIRDLYKVCNHVHLPVQSGSSKILKEMNRKYSKEQYLELVKSLQKEVPDIALSTDIIVGFPGETEEDFNDTLDVIRKVRYDSAFTFLYSIREGTPAAKMTNQIPDKIKHERFNRLLEELNKIILDKNQNYLNKKCEILVEDISKNNPNFLTGRTRTNKLVHFEGNNNLIGNIVKVEITKAKTWFLEGKLILED